MASIQGVQHGLPTCSNSGLEAAGLVTCALMSSIRKAVLRRDGGRPLEPETSDRTPSEPDFFVTASCAALINSIWYCAMTQ